MGKSGINLSFAYKAYLESLSLEGLSLCSLCLCGLSLESLSLVGYSLEPNLFKNCYKKFQIIKFYHCQIISIKLIRSRDKLIFLQGLFNLIIIA